MRQLRDYILINKALGDAEMVDFETILDTTNLKQTIFEWKPLIVHE